MTRPHLWFVDATILSALITPEPASEQLLRWLSYGYCNWITSEISVSLTLATLERRGLSLQQQQACLERLLLVLHHGIGLRPLPLQALQPERLFRPQRHQLSPLLALQLHTALHWRCATVVSEEPALVACARQEGLHAMSLTIAVPQAP